MIAANFDERETISIGRDPFFGPIECCSGGSVNVGVEPQPTQRALSKELQRLR